MVDSAEFQELDDERRPYAPAANVVAVLERVRRVNLPDVVDPDLLRIAGVSEGAMGRVLYALRFLRLTDANGRPTDRLRAIARAPEEEWRDLLAGVVREAYASDFARIDPSQDPQPRIVSAFKRYEPRSQTDRMVMLFLGLAKAAGIPVLDAPRERNIQAAKIGTKAAARPAAGRGPVHNASVRAESRGKPAGASDGHDDALPRGSLFDITVEDIGVLGEADFQEVWAALGKVARARALARKSAETAKPDEEIANGEQLKGAGPVV